MRLIFLLSMVAQGCVSSTLPAPLSPAESQQVSNVHLKYSVGVESYRWPAYSNDLLTTLQHTKLFDSVLPLDQCATPPAIIARVEQPYNGGVATIPIWTFLTLGIIPTIERESFGYDFSLQFTGEADRCRHGVKYVCESTTTMGWIALPEALSPDVCLWSCERSDRFLSRLTIAILEGLSAGNR